MTDIIPGLAAKYGVPEWIIRNMVKAESGGQHYTAGGGYTTSPKGAFGIAQLMPGTAKYVQQKYGVDPRTPHGNLEGGVAYLDEQIERFGSPELGLAAYNAGPGAVQRYGGVPPYAETQKYVQSILGANPNGGGAVGGAVGSSAAPPAPVTPPRGAARRSFAANLIGSLGPDKRSQHRQLIQSIMALRQAKRAEQAPAQAAAGQVPLAFSRGNGSTEWGGSKGIADQFAGIGLGLGLKAVSEKRDRMTTKSGGVSDHWTGSQNAYAYDLSNGSQPTPQMDAAAHQIARQLGVEWDGRSPLEIRKTIDGYRIQVLYRTNTGGNHFDHIHVGVRRVG